MRFLVTWLVMLAGCDTVFGLDRTGQPTDAKADGDTRPSITLTCADKAIIDDELTDPAPCKPWGNAFANTGTSIEQTMGQLRIRTAAHSVGGGAGCTGIGPSRPLSAGGLMVVVSSVLETMGAYTAINFGDNTLQVVNDEITFADQNGNTTYGKTPYKPASMRVWRIYAQSGRVFAAYSADGTTWFAVGDHAGSPPTDIPALFGGDSIDVGTTTGTATYDRVVLCP